MSDKPFGLLPAPIKPFGLLPAPDKPFGLLPAPIPDIRTLNKVLPSSGQVFRMKGQVPPWYHPDMIGQKYDTKVRPFIDKAVIQAYKAGFYDEPYAVTIPKRLSRLAEFISSRASSSRDWINKALENEQTREAVLSELGSKSLNAVEKATGKVVGAGRWASNLWPMRFIKRHPVLTTATILASGSAAATGAIAVQGASSAMTQNKMYMMHAAQQRQSIEQAVMPHDTRRQVQSTFSGRRVRGGHMGATGDLVFAMNNRRKG